MSTPYTHGIYWGISRGYMVWTTFNPVEAIPWVAGKIVVHGIPCPVYDDYPVDNMSHPVGASLQLYPVDTSREHFKISRGLHIPWMYPVDNMKISRGCQMILYPVGV